MSDPKVITDDQQMLDFIKRIPTSTGLTFESYILCMGVVMVFKGREYTCESIDTSGSVVVIHCEGGETVTLTTLNI